MTIIIRRPWTRQPSVAQPLPGTFAVMNPAQGFNPPFSGGVRAIDEYRSEMALLSSPGSRLVIAADESTVLPSGSQATILVHITQYGNSINAALTNGVYSAGQDFNFYLNFSGTLYFRWAGSTPGVTDLSFSSTEQVGVFLLSVGPEGMQVWKDGKLLGENTATPSRTASTNPLQFQDTADNAYTITSSLFATWARQFPKARNASLSRNPWQIFQPNTIIIPSSVAAPSIPTLSASTYVTGSLTSTGWRPQVTAS